jgi:hypothetical protein
LAAAAVPAKAAFDAVPGKPGNVVLLRYERGAPQLRQ